MLFEVMIIFDYCEGYYIIYMRGVAQPGSALGLGPRGREFESLHPDAFYNHQRIIC